MFHFGNVPVAVGDIYSFILEQFPFYRKAKSGWKNSIRHNLSLNRYFTKVEKEGDDQRKGTLWAMTEGTEKDMREDIDHCRDRHERKLAGLTPRTRKRRSSLHRLKPCNSGRQHIPSTLRSDSLLCNPPHSSGCSSTAGMPKPKPALARRNSTMTRPEPKAPEAAVHSSLRDLFLNQHKLDADSLSPDIFHALASVSQVLACRAEGCRRNLTLGCPSERL
jgi:forkhead box protein N